MKFLAYVRDVWRGIPSAPGARLASSLQRLTIRTALYIGFAMVLALWLVSGYVVVQRLNEVENRAAGINRRFVQNEGLLYTIRTEVLLGAVYLRDAVLDTGLQDADYYRERLMQTREEISRAQNQYVLLVDSPAERESWARLQAEIEDYWKTALPVLAWDPDRRLAEARSFLRRQVIPKRDGIVRISEQIQGLNRIALQEQQAQIADVYEETRRWVWTTSGISLLLGMGIALLVTHYAGRLESRIRQQHQMELRNKSDLQRLSARLVNAQEEERRAIARELHDEVGQALTAIKMDLSLAERNLASADAARSRATLEEARGVADRTLHAVRDLSQLLHPAMLDDLGLPDTLNWYLRGFSKRTGIRTDLVHERMGTRLPPAIELAAYRILQEALTNVARHSRATKCRVFLQRLSYTLLLTVEDDGVGFVPGAPGSENRPRGLGLVGIQERVAALGGSFRLESSPGKGVRLSVELPAGEVETAVGEEAQEDVRLKT